MAWQFLASYTYPSSPVWTKTRDESYALHWCYVASRSADLASIQQEREHQLNLAVPPEVDAIWDVEQEKYSYPIVPGCITPPASWPLRTDIDNGVGLKGYRYIAAYHTPSSLELHYPEVWKELAPLASRLKDLAFGHRATTPSEESILPLFAYAQLKENDRSKRSGVKKGTAKTRVQFEGSYSLGTTIEKGHGIGIVKPVSQLSTPKFEKQLAEVFQILAAFYRILVPLSISKYEWEMLKFQLQDNNVFTLGGRGPAGVSVQMNVSASYYVYDGADLGESIGRVQGSLHPDSQDCLTTPTLLTIMIRLPKHKKAAGGSFLLARYGIHIPFSDIWFINIVFDGRTIHGGRQISIKTEEAEDMESLVVNVRLDEWETDPLANTAQELWNAAAAVNRLAFVQYFPDQAVKRTANIALHGPALFGNYGTHSPAVGRVKTFSSGGKHLMGTLQEFYSTIGVELVWGFLNSLSQANLTLVGFDATRLLQQIQYTESGSNGNLETTSQQMTSQQHALILPEFDVLNPEHSAHVHMCRGWLAWLMALRECNALGIMADEFFKKQDLLAKQATRSRSSKECIEAQRPKDHRQGVLVHRQETSQVVLHLPSTQILPTNVTSDTEDVLPVQVTEGTLTGKRRKRNSEGKEIQPKKKLRQKPEVVGMVGQEFEEGTRTYAEFEIEAIIGHAFHGGMYKYLVQWKHYSEDHNEWIPETDLNNAQDLLRAYKSCWSLHDTLTVCDSKRYKNFSRHCLDKLFDAEKLSKELDTFKKLQDRFISNRSSISGGYSDLTAFITSYTAMNDRQFAWTSMLIKSPLRVPTSSVEPVDQNDSLCALVFRFQDALSDLSRCQSTSYTLKLWDAAVRRQECRSLLILFDFVVFGMPMLLKILTQTYVKDRIFLKQHYPAFFPLVDAVMQDLTALRSQCRRQGGKAPDASNILRPIPSNLYGLRRDSHFSEEPLSLKAKWIDGGDDALTNAANQVLEDALIEFLAMPYFRKFSAKGSTKPGKKTKCQESDTSIFEDCLIRGAILHALAEGLDDESIFFSARIETFVLQGGVTGLWNDGVSKMSVKRIAKNIRDDPELHLSHVRLWAFQEVPKASRDAAWDLAYALHKGITELIAGRRMSDDEYQGVERSNPKPKQKKPNAKMQKGAALAGLTPEALCIGRSHLSFGALALILQETWRDMNQAPPIHEELHRYLKGLDIRTGRILASGDPDHAYPIRQTNQGSLLLNEHLPREKLVTKYGLSNLLSWHGTGQGYKTSRFLAFLKQKAGSRSFWSASLNECINHFLAAQIHNQVLASSRPDVQISPEHEGLSEALESQGFLRLSNCRVYGQPSNMLKLLPTLKTFNSWGRTIPAKCSFEQRIRDKFTPYWTNTICEKWKEFLGDMFDCNNIAACSQKSRHSWSETIEFVNQLKVPGFNSGLTAMQLVNALALAEVVSSPTLAEMAHWIWTHSELGAFKGLKLIGFNMLSEDAVLVALTCFCRHIWKGCIPEWREKLGCEEDNVIGAEHFLCKISRWTDKIPHLKEIAEELESRVGELTLSGTGLDIPIPVTASMTFVQDVLNEIRQ
ncbi:hypothetical protein VNI00_012157 [Paramarasmius palmivorus]|uniref:Chromo domain-containing protein n=1 Tax=Paramarasmius palmivorus TaxID=297713 RepID=A0AAW0CA96_9AGAR